MHSSSGTAFEAAHARFRTPVRDHFISIRIVRRLNVKPTKDSSMIKRCILNNQFASSTSYYVDLACYGDADRYSVYRLFVVIDPPFDLLFGFTVNGQSAVTGDKKRAAADRPKPA